MKHYDTPMPAEPESTPPRKPRSLEEQMIFGETVDEMLENLSLEPRPVDLRTVPQEQWADYVGFELVLPPEVERWIDGATSYSKEEIDAIEAALEKYHGLTPPFGAYLSVPLKGRPTASLVRE